MLLLDVEEEKHAVRVFFFVCVWWSAGTNFRTKLKLQTTEVFPSYCLQKVFSSCGRWHLTIGDAVRKTNAVIRSKPLLIVWIYKDVVSCCFGSDTQLFRLHLLQGPAQETASCGGRVESWKETFSCPANLTPLLRVNQKRNTLVKTKGKWERKREWAQKSEASCLAAASS